MALVMLFSTMPELPEVETLRRELAKMLPGEIIERISVSNLKTIYPLSPHQFNRRLRGKKVATVERRAKMLLIKLRPNNLTLAIHLKMTGQLIFVPHSLKQKKEIVGGHPQENPFRYTRVALHFKGGDALFFNDLRKFGWLKILNPEDLANLDQRHGEEPLDSKFSFEIFEQLLDRSSKRQLKPLLLDQKLIAGLGNIYADEACFRSRVKPDRVTSSLNKTERQALYRAIREVLQLSIKHGGTSARDYRRSDGSRGGFAAKLKVYGRSGDKCPRCHHFILKKKFVGRGTHFCPNCQK